MQTEQWKILHAGELAFFASISASVSHEIKNHLAIINEQNGLIGDYLDIGSKGMPAPLEKIRNVVQGVTKQVALTDHIVRRFNMFAHTGDTPVKSIDVSDFLHLLVDISVRQVRNSEMRLELEEMPTNIIIRTHPFEFLHVLHSCLSIILKNGAQGDTVSLGFSVEEQGVSVVLSAPEGLKKEAFQPLDPTVSLLMERLQIRFTWDPNKLRLSLVFPMGIDREAPMH